MISSAGNNSFIIHFSQVTIHWQPHLATESRFLLVCEKQQTVQDLVK